MTRKITTAKQALELLEQVVAEKGEDYIYNAALVVYGVQRCRYVEGGAPACLIAHALFKAGYTIGDLKAVDSPFTISADNLPLHSHFNGLSEEAAKVFGFAQKVQDNGGTWGAALRAAKVYVEEKVSK